MNIKDKILKITILLFIILIFISSSVLAVSCDYTFTYNDKEYSINEDLLSQFSFLLVCKNASGYVFLLSNAPITYSSEYDSKFYCNSDFYYYSGSEATVTLYPNLSLEDLTYITNGSLGFNHTGLANSSIVYASEDVYDENGELVFQGAPLAPVGVVEPMKIQQVEEIPLMMEKIIKMILPVCLIIFGTLLVIYLIKSKNLLQL